MKDNICLINDVDDIKDHTGFFILAGGRSRRMGGIDKGLIQLDKHPLIEHVILRIHNVFPNQELAVITNHSPKYAFLQDKYPIVLYTDVCQGLGSLGGLYSALSYNKKRFTVVVACDMPFVDAKLLKEGIETLIKTQASAFVPIFQGKFQPFHAVYHTQACYNAVKMSLAVGNRKSCAWFSGVNMIIKEITENDVGELSPFYNINTPQDLKRAEELWQMNSGD